MSQHDAEYNRCVEKIKGMAGLPVRRAKTIRESIRDNSFREAIDEAIHCKLIENWPLSEQKKFLDNLVGLTDAEKNIRIHETAYQLYKIWNTAVSST